MSTIVSKNRKASFEYTFIDVYEAGIKLLGSEVKPVKQNKCSINEAFCFFKDGELYIKNMHIAQYEQSGKSLNHDVLRDKKLLLNKKQLLKLEKGMQVKGNTIIPIKVYITFKGLIKIEIALSKGKKTYDKSKAIKEKDIKVDSEREIKNK